MREFVDLGIKPKKGSLEAIVKVTVQLGYSRIGLESKLASDIIDLVNRIDLYPMNQNDLGKKLQRHRNKAEIIVVHCTTKSVARQAARDNRVDFVRFPISDGKPTHFLDRRQARLMRDTGSGYEVSIHNLLVDDGLELVKRINVIRKSLSIAMKHDLPVVASSGAQDIYGLREPFGLVSVLSLLGVDEDSGLDMISIVPNAIIEENRAKLGPNFIEPGVWILDE